MPARMASSEATAAARTHASSAGDLTARNCSMMPEPSTHSTSVIFSVSPLQIRGGKNIVSSSTPTRLPAGIAVLTVRMAASVGSSSSSKASWTQPGTWAATVERSIARLTSTGSASTWRMSMVKAK